MSKRTTAIETANVETAIETANVETAIETANVETANVETANVETKVYTIQSADGIEECVVLGAAVMVPAGPGWNLAREDGPKGANGKALSRGKYTANVDADTLAERIAAYNAAHKAGEGAGPSSWISGARKALRAQIGEGGPVGQLNLPSFQLPNGDLDVERTIRFYADRLPK